MNGSVTYNMEFDIRTMSYGLGFFPFIYKSTGRNKDPSLTARTEKTWLARYLLHL